ncbi:MAG TPA: hypothetical protein VFV10_00485 [Gammaproteobacteria bacterium]|nr:hypothetical protein [Gammaproteobacteria bacterium]
MRFDTEDLLTIRDGEPIGLTRKAELLADADHVLELARLERVKRGLRDLPEIAPPAEGWNRIAAALDARPRSARAAVWRAAAAAACVAALVALASAMLSSRMISSRMPSTVIVSSGGSESTTADRGAEPERSLPAPSARGIAPASVENGRPDADDTSPRSYAQLVAESERLERALARLRFHPEVMNAGTAGTIASLEDTLAALDEQITFAAAGGLDAGDRRTLWQERVNVMNALVQVRYAEAQRPTY